ncbi:hypothetical protein HDU98_007091 [Podochytrium sp. JEL0797]|nr:hypothetical protein HDU98_007091 [Podochytrium sp. JEL0797]
MYYPQGNDSLFTINQLLELCHRGNALTLTREWALEANEEVIVDNYLGDCYPFESSIDQGGRSMGHCSDFVNYIHHANVRLVKDLPHSIYESKATKCPRSSYLHGEFPNNIFYGHRRTLRNIWMPNLEQIHAAQEWYFAVTHAFLCKTKITCIAIQKYLDARGIVDVKARFMAHSSPDTRESVKGILGIDAREENRDFNSFFLAYGHSARKHAFEVLHRFYIKWYNNIQIHQYVSYEALRRMQFTRGVHICASEQEGYGHYINEARSLGALIVTTDHPPMNEFVEDRVSGILVGHDAPKAEAYQFMAPYFVSPVRVKVEDVCRGVERVFGMDVEARRKLGSRARERYELDTRVMEENMVDLHKEAIDFLMGI